MKTTVNVMIKRLINFRKCPVILILFFPPLLRTEGRSWWAADQLCPPGSVFPRRQILPTPGDSEETLWPPAHPTAPACSVRAWQTEMDGWRWDKKSGRNPWWNCGKKKCKVFWARVAEMCRLAHILGTVDVLNIVFQFFFFF